MLDQSLIRRWNKDVLDEIQRHKWLESERVGQDIGSNGAAFDWLERHYDSWCRKQDYLGPLFS